MLAPGNNLQLKHLVPKVQLVTLWKGCVEKLSAVEVLLMIIWDDKIMN